MMTSLWPSAMLGQIATLFDSLHKTPAYAVTGYPMIRVTDIRRGYATTSGAVRVDESTFEEFSKKHKPTTGDILFSRVGSYGNSSFVKNAEPFCLGQNTVCISPDRSVIEPFHLFSFLNSPAASQQIEAFVGGASQPTISLKSIALIVVPLPPMRTQRRIASILSAYDDLIENNTRRIAVLEEMARRLYDEWFVHFRFPGHEQVRMVESELGLIPEGWQIGRMDDALILQRGFDLPAKDRIPGPHPVIAATGIHGTNDQFKVKGPGIVTGRSGSLGTVSYVPHDFWPLNTTLWVKEFRAVSPLVSFFMLERLDFAGLNAGAAVPTLNRNDVHALLVVLPPRHWVAEFDRIVQPMIDMKIRLERKNTNLRAQRDLLLPKLISGEIDVSTFPEAEAVAA